jgi:hypothetical protein
MVNRRRGVVDTVEGLAVVASDVVVDDADSEANLEKALDASWKMGFLKGSLTQDFWKKIFSRIGFRYAISNFTKIRGDIVNFLFIAGVNAIGDKLILGVNDTGDIWSSVSF